MFNQMQIIAGIVDRIGVPILVFVAVIAFLLLSPRTKRRRCLRCQELNKPHARYCAQCGAEFRKS